MRDTVEEVTALVPFRCPRHGKMRLRQELSEHLCDQLTEAMFRDVVSALTGSRVTRTVVVIHGGCGEGATRRAAVNHLVEPHGLADLNEALEWAVAQLTTVRVLIVPGDLPCLRPSDIDRVLARSEDVVVAPTEDGGTGALAFRRPDRIQPHFGGHSALRHAMTARRSRVTHAIVQSRGFLIDVDHLDDLNRALAIGVGRETERVTQSLLSAATVQGRVSC